MTMRQTRAAARLVKEKDEVNKIQFQENVQVHHSRKELVGYSECGAELVEHGLIDEEDVIYYCEDEEEHLYDIFYGMGEYIEEFETAEQVKSDAVSVYYLNAMENECFMKQELEVRVVELPRKEHNTPEVKEAKEKEINNLNHFKVYKEVEHKDQKYIDVRWVVTRKEKQDGEKKPMKARFV